MEAYVQRMVDEAKALRAKCHALRGFLNGKNVHSLCMKKQMLMQKQLGEMETYLGTLQERVDLELQGE